MDDQAIRLRQCAQAAMWRQTTIVTLGVCGMKGGVGTTTVAAALATRFVRLGLRTLLVDATGSGDVATIFRPMEAGPPGPPGSSTWNGNDSIPELADRSGDMGNLAGRFDDPSRFDRIVFDLGNYREHEAAIRRTAWSLHRLIPVTTVHPGALATCVECVSQMSQEGLGDRLDVLFNGVEPGSDPRRFHSVCKWLESACMERAEMVPRLAGSLRRDPAIEPILFSGERTGNRRGSNGNGFGGNGRSRRGVGRRSERGFGNERGGFFVDLERFVLQLLPQSQSVPWKIPLPQNVQSSLNVQNSQNKQVVQNVPLNLPLPQRVVEESTGSVEYRRRVA